MNKIYHNIVNGIEVFAKWVGIIVGIIGGLIIVVTSISQFFAWGDKGLFVYLRINFQNIWMIVVSVVVLGILVWATLFNRRFINRFTDNFKKDLSLNWDFEGQWRIAEENTLLVTGSDSGGITKIGSTWENYTFTCDAKITRKCLGVIVRAQDLNNYYMFQIRPDKIRPHRRIAVPLIEDAITNEPNNDKENINKSQPEEKDIAKYKFVKYDIIWQVFDPPTPINPRLDDWFKVKVIVHGESIQLYINNELRFQSDAFLKIPMGKVGFRNHMTEIALVRNVRVLVHS